MRRRNRVGERLGGLAWLREGVCIAGLILLPLTARPADVAGYSILKGQFLLQTDADTVVLDPDFGFTFLASVDLTDFDLVESASVRLPDGEELLMDGLGDFWSLLDVADTQSALDEAYTWGDYFLVYETVNDGDFSCLVSLPEAPLPPKPRLVNFADVQSVDTAKALTLTWEFDAPPQSNDFVQVYVSLGHGDVFSTPDLGQPGALDGSARSVTIPPNTLDPDWTQSLNLEITRLVSTNSECYPDVQGVGAIFSSTEIDLVPVVLPMFRLISAPANGVVFIEVRAEPERPIVLEGSDRMAEWSGVSTNAAASGTVVFEVPIAESAYRFFRAWQR